MNRVAGHLQYRVRQVRRRVTMARRSRLVVLPPSYPPRLPPVPDGFVTGPPDFVGVGVQKCGTTWWFHCISSHPRIHLAGEAWKEIHYFDDYWQHPFRPEDVEGYARYFPRGPGMITGEWTPRYMFDHWAPSLLHRCAPDARILVLLRDPVERYPSGLVQEIHKNDYVSLYRYKNAATTSAARGLYHQQLRMILRHYPREHVLVQQYEKLMQDPVSELRRAWAFIGLDFDEEAAAKSIPDRVNVTTHRKDPLDSNLRQDLIDFYADDLERLLQDFGDSIDPALWPACAALKIG